MNQNQVTPVQISNLIAKYWQQSEHLRIGGNVSCGASCFILSQCCCFGFCVPRMWCCLCCCVNIEVLYGLKVLVELFSPVMQQHWYIGSSVTNHETSHSLQVSGSVVWDSVSLQTSVEHNSRRVWRVNTGINLRSNVCTSCDKTQRSVLPLDPPIQLLLPQPSSYICGSFN